LFLVVSLSPERKMHSFHFEHNHMNIKYLGQSSFLIETKGKTLLFDPMITSNPMADHINVDQIKPDYILLTHGHGDHVADAEYIAKQSGAKIISNYEVVSWYEQKGLDGHPMNLGGKWTFDFGTVKYVNAVHSSMLPDGSYGGASGGFVVYNDEVCFYVAGDTALTLDMQLIPRTCPKLDFAILPIGDNFTMGYDDAVIAAEFVQCDKIIACHFDTFGYIKVDHQAVLDAFAKASKTIVIPQIGENITL
jgi:L-ascorbate metabolism protein UlaG (beta-lactamase superfamily)